MKMSGLLRRSRTELPGSPASPGSTAAHRCAAPPAQARRHRRARPARSRPRDRRRAGRRRASGVVNAAPSISGRFPNLGPGVLVDAGIPLVDRVGAEVLHAIKDGSRIRLHEGVLYAGDVRWPRASSRPPSPSPTRWSRPSPGCPPAGGVRRQHHRVHAARAGAAARRRRRPGLEVELSGRQVLVVAAGFDHAAELKRLKSFIREYRPVLVGVGAGADALRAAGLHARPHRRRPGRDLQRGAAPAARTSSCPRSPTATPPVCTGCRTSAPARSRSRASANPEDLALLLAAHHGASHDRHGRALGDHGRVPRPRPVGQQRLDLPDPAADRRLSSSTAHVIAALYRSRVSIGAIAADAGRGPGRGGAPRCSCPTAGDALLAWPQQLTVRRD